MTENKMRPTDQPVADFIAALDHPQKEEEAWRLVSLMQEITSEKPRMWGPAIIGFGSYHYTYSSGRQGDTPLIGFSTRKNRHAIYVEADFPGKAELLARLGKHKTSKVCVYINKLADVDEDVLAQLIRASVAQTKEKYPNT